MKNIFSVFLILALLFSFAGCSAMGVSFSVEDGAANINNSYFTPTMYLCDDEETKISDDELWQELVFAINGQPIAESPVLSGEECDCEIEYIIRVIGAYPNGYYLSFHEDGIEISAYCKFRKCMDLLGIVKVDEDSLERIAKRIEEIK